MNPTYDRFGGEIPGTYSRNDSTERLATGLGWFSIGLGLAEVLAPSSLAGLIGIRDDSRTRNILRTYGLREIAAGVGILMQPRPAEWMWGRVAGDVLDLATLGAAFREENADAGKLATATAAVLGVTALDLVCAQQLTTSPAESSQPGHHRVTSTVTINREPAEVYRFWRNFGNLPRFMWYLEAVHVVDDRLSHWVAKGPGGRNFEWDAEIVDDRLNEMIVWRSLPGSDIENAGRVSFQRATGGRGTYVTVDLEYVPPGGIFGATFAKLFGREPGQEIDTDLRRFKQVMETGDIVRSDASIHEGMHPAQPPASLAGKDVR